jgi:hypothetical protein
MIFSRKDFASNARNQVSLTNVLTMDHRIMETSTIGTLTTPLLSGMTTEHLFHATTISSEMYTIRSRNQDHEKSTR